MIILWVNIQVLSPPSWNSFFRTTLRDSDFLADPDFWSGPTIQLGPDLLTAYTDIPWLHALSGYALWLRQLVGHAIEEHQEMPSKYPDPHNTDPITGWETHSPMRVKIWPGRVEFCIGNIRDYPVRGSAKKILFPSLQSADPMKSLEMTILVVDEN